jgi:hypothetical protein
MDGEWHEFESKQRKRAQKALEKEERRASAASKSQMPSLSTERVNETSQ